MLVGKREYGTANHDSSIYKDKKGFYVVAARSNGPIYKKYLKGWRPDADIQQLCMYKKNGRGVNGINARGQGQAGLFDLKIKAP